MLYLDAFFANLNAVVRVADFFSCKETGLWADQNVEFEQNKFYYITKGSCVIHINGKDYHGKPGDCFFIPANTRHDYRNVQGAVFEKYWFHFDLYPNSSIFKLLDLDYCIKAKDNALLTLFAELFQKFNSEKLTDKLDAKSLAIKILSSYIAASPKETNMPSPNTEEAITTVLSYINQHLSEHISNAVLSELCYLHPNHFVRFFKKKTGMTPQRYIMEQRVQMAKRLIEQTDMKFSDIAVHVGLCDAPHLCKVFKRFYSLNPQDCRKEWDIR